LCVESYCHTVNSILSMASGGVKINQHETVTQFDTIHRRARGNTFNEHIIDSASSAYGARVLHSRNLEVRHLLHAGGTPCSRTPSRLRGARYPASPYLDTAA